MAHFAQLDETNTVTQVIVVNNNVIDNAQGLEKETKGIDFCKSLYGDNTVWKQTSYNRSFRKNYAGQGCLYDPIRDAFIGPKPNEGNWILNEETLLWELDSTL
jgi:hypothetical protein